jgi:hypothetical protein
VTVHVISALHADRGPVVLGVCRSQPEWAEVESLVAQHIIAGIGEIPTDEVYIGELRKYAEITVTPVDLLP